MKVLVGASNFTTSMAFHGVLPEVPAVADSSGVGRATLDMYLSQVAGDPTAQKLHDAMRTADPSGGLEKCWQGKEMLRRLLALAGTDPDRRVTWNTLTDFHTHCADSEIAQLRRLAWTVHAWQPSIIEDLRTGISNGRTEGNNPIVKHVGRIGFGFRNTENHKRRIRFACTRASRRRQPEPCGPC